MIDLDLDYVKNSPAYEVIRLIYGDTRAQRSNVLLIQHINEGIRILQHLGCGNDTKDAFCMHPIFQDTEFRYKQVQEACDVVGGPVVALALEYRNIANQYLAKRSINSIDEIQLSSVGEVQQMLIADKVQNYKDFLLYHYGTHENSDRLDQYFKNWFNKLQVDFHKVHDAVFR